MTNISAAIGLAQLERAEEILEKKYQISQWYQEALISLPVQFHKEQPDSHHSYWMCSILVDPVHREPLRNYLAKAGIETRPLFYPVHTFPPYLSDISLPIAELLGSSGINLPSFPELSESQVLFICQTIRQFYHYLTESKKKIANFSLLES
jgi:perosamine synthetase